MSKNVHIVTDSTSDLPVDLAKTWNITVVPLNVHFGQESYKEGVELTQEEFYKKLATSEVMPKTSQPAPGDFKEVFERLSKDGGPIISLHIGSTFSGTYQSAVMAKEMLPGLDITVIDTHTATGAQGLIVLAAARKCREGASKEEILNAIENAMSKVRMYLLVDTLEYLEKNGRIGRAASLLGSVLSLKPILTLSEGSVTPVEKIRGKAKALARGVELLENEFKGRKIRLLVLDADAKLEGDKMAQDLEGALKPLDVVRGTVGAVIGSHLGPGSLVATVLPED